MVTRGCAFQPKMERSICQFDKELQLLRREKLGLYPQLKLADLHQLTLYQELLLLRDFQGREEKLQEKLNACIKEENNITVRDSVTTRALWSSQTWRVLQGASVVFNHPYIHPLPLHRP